VGSISKSRRYSPDVTGFNQAGMGFRGEARNDDITGKRVMNPGGCGKQRVIE
jgi:hypothetical protein